MLGELEKLDENLGGVADMKRQPDAVFIIDLRKEQLAVREARRLGLPVIAVVDTNSDPDEADYIIPGNDDAIRSCDLIVRVVADGIAAGQQKATPADFTPPAKEPETETVPEGDYEQVSPGEEPIAEEPVAEESVGEEPVAEEVPTNG
jgi:small subunit ribosomal protein S2